VNPRGKGVDSLGGGVNPRARGVDSLGGGVLVHEAEDRIEVMRKEKSWQPYMAASVFSNTLYSMYMLLIKVNCSSYG
jgi:hypothetical protein